MYPGEDYYASFISKNGYPKSDDKFVFQVGQTFVTSDSSRWQYLAETGTFKIAKSYITEGTSPYIFKIESYDKYVDIDFESATLRKDGDDQAVFGQEYETGFYVNCGISEYAPKNLSDITVMDEDRRAITASCRFDENGKLHIPANLIRGNKIYIVAEEAGRVKRTDKDYKVVLTQRGVERYFENVAMAKSIIELDYPTTVLLTDNVVSGEMPSESINLKNKVNFSLNGNTMEAGSANNPIFLINDKNADVSIENATLKATSAEGNQLIRVESGLLTLNNVKTAGYENADSYAYATGGGKIVADGIDSSVNITLGADGALELKNGVIEHLDFGSNNVNVKFYGGTVKSVNTDAKTDWLSMIEERYAYELSNTNDCAALINGDKITGSFTVRKANLVVIQPQELSVECKTAATLKASGTEGCEYTWICSDNSIADADSLNQSELKIKDTAPLGEYTAYCVVTLESLVSKSNTVKITVICEHNLIGENGVCEKCGKQFAVKTQNNGGTSFYDDIFEAAKVANENENTKITLLSDITESGKKPSDDPNLEFTTANIDFNGVGTVLDLNEKTLKIVYENARVSVNGQMTINGNGTMDAQVSVNGNGELTVENGTFKRVYVGYECKATLNGGKFANIAGNNADYSKFLGKGKAYMGTEGENKGKFNTKKYEFCSTFQSIYNVEITDAPFAVTEQPKGKYLEAGAENETVSVTVEENEAYKGKISYQWYVKTWDPIEYDYIDIEEVGNAAAVTVNTTGLPGGAHRTYQCVVSCNGYEIKTECAVFTIGKGELTVDIDSGYIDTKGNDCVIILAAYFDGMLIAAEYDNLTKESEIYDLIDVLNPLNNALCNLGVTDFTELKLYFWDSFSNMTPFREHIVVTY